MTTSHANIAALFSDIADQIRFKQGTTSSYVADTFPEAIKSLGENWIDRTITKFPLSTTCTINIGSCAFYSCTQMSGTVQTNSTLLYNNAFYYCTKITTASFPNVTSVYTYAFYNCVSLTTLSFPNLISMGNYAFTYCSNLTTVNFPKVSFVGSSAFASDYKLTTVSLPLTSRIYNYAFAYCSSLATLSLPKCTSIYTYAFRNCIRLVSLYLMGSTLCTLGGSNAFSSTPIGGYSTTAGQFGKVYVPTSLYSSYIAAANWSLISSRIVSA